jgi:tetratricopeptide (TPR) repeat protein
VAAVELDPGAPLPYFFLGRAYTKIGEHRKAIAALTTAVRLGSNLPLFESSLGYAYAPAGERAKAERILERLNGPRRAGVSPIDLAVVRLGLGETEAALNALEDGCAGRVPRMINLNDPFFSELAGRPRYQQLLATLRLPSGSC